MSSFVDLPIAAKMTGAGSSISEMATMVGWATFAIEHVMFGLALGALAFRAAPATVTGSVSDGVRSAILS